MTHVLADMVQNNNFFEGVEKLLEVWFFRKDGMTAGCDLRKIPRLQLELLMQTVKCEIISAASSDDLDAYVLSESSMFISSRRFILKTCGSTTPLLCLPLLVSMAKEYAGFDCVQDLYYSRKNFKRPELQLTPHRNFEEEAQILDTYFPDRGGRAYCMGSLNGEDCWYLYVISPGHTRKELGSRHRPGRRLGKLCLEADQTLEILMTDVDPEKMVYFYKDKCSTAEEATKRSGIDNLIPGLIIDDFQFEPCGYSMNGMSRSVPGGYMTIHVTPEPEFSYVSFETNITYKNYKDLINRVVETFGPKQFVVTLFSSESSFRSIGIDEDWAEDEPEYSNYFAEDVQICRLPGYNLTYALFDRFPS